MNVNKLLIATLLAMCIVGFSMSSVSAKEITYHNTMEVNKTYIVYDYGRKADWVHKDGNNVVHHVSGDTDINMYIGTFLNYYDDHIGSAYGDTHNIWIRYTNTGSDRDMRTASDLWNRSVVSVFVLDNKPDISHRVYGVRPLVAGHYQTRTQHEESGDKYYEWDFV